MLAHSQRLDSIGRLAGGIAHDFNNLLSVIISYTELAIDGIRDNPPMAADLGEIMEAARRAELLTSQLLTFSRRDSKKVELVDLSQLLGRAGRMLHRVLGEEVHLTIRGNDHPHVVQGDAAQLEQVVVNLAVNARDAMPTGGALSLALADVELDADQAALHGLIAGAYVELAVQDSGGGMDEFTRDHIFEPFFTTKSVGKGTGLGLAMAFGVVQQCGGTIGVDTAIGEGSTFRIHLPRVVDPTLVDKGVPARAPTTATPGDQSILLVEDDAAVRRVVQRILVHAGYRVISCASPEEALEYVEQPGTHVDLLFTDIVMPRMRGTELAQRVSTLAPATRILFMSGYAHLEGETSLAHPIVQKPFQRHDVLAQVAARLRG
ncbi:MAG: response regulator [Proteobacteria bacterium]|nr:response regulator [Pseudomonadota bacterium]